MSLNLQAASAPMKMSIKGVPSNIKKNIQENLKFEIIDLMNLEAEDREYQLKKIKSTTEKAITPFGYYHSNIDITLNDQTRPFQLLIVIALNDPTFVDKIDFTLSGPGENDPLLNDIFYNSMLLDTGDIFNHTQYENSKKRLLANANLHGYLKADFDKSVVTVDLSEYSADIDLTLNSNELYYFGPVTFKTDCFDHSFLERFLKFEPGNRYHPDFILDLDRDLAQSQYFQSIDVNPIIEDDNTLVPIDVMLKPAPKNKYLLGVGYDTDTKSRAKVGWERRRVNRYGHRFSSLFSISEKDTLVEGNYIIPGKHPQTDDYRISAYYNNDEFKDKPSELYKIALSQTREIYGWQRIISLQYLDEKFKDTDLIEQRTQFLIPNIALTKVKSDNPASPTYGYRLHFNVKGSINGFLADKSFLQTYFDYKWLKELTQYQTLIARTQAGFTLPDSTKDIPPSLRFYAGGDQSLRGFRYRSLPSEIDEDGNLRPVGASSLLLGSVEVQQKVYGPIRLAGFVDGGNAFNHFHDPFKLSAGAGIRWQTPLGPLKVDFAKGINHGPNPLRVHFSFGPEL